MNKKIKILHIFGCMNIGGAETRTLDIMKHIDEEKFQMDFCALSGQRGELEEEIQVMGGTTHHCKLSWGFNSRFLKILQDGHYDVVHSHVHMFSGYILWLAARAGVFNRIAHFRSMADGQNDSFRRIIQRLVMRRLINKYATNIIAVSEGTMSSAWGEQWRQDLRCNVVYNGIDWHCFQGKADRLGVFREFGIPATSQLVIHVGNFGVAKNHTRIISIFKKLILKTNCCLLLVGKEDTSISDAIKAKIKAEGLSDRIIIAGRRKDVPRLLKGSDVMVFPSLREGLPGAVLEACAAGIPVVASDLPGIKEIEKYIKSITCLSLEADDECWAEEIISSMHLNCTKDTNGFLDSPFLVEKASDLLGDIWYRQN